MRYIIGFILLYICINWENIKYKNTLRLEAFENWRKRERERVAKLKKDFGIT